MGVALTGKFKEIAPRIRCGLASEEELRSIAVEDVLAIKSDGEFAHYRTLSRPVCKTLDEQSRSVDHVASDETVDRVGDIIRVKGWQLDNFKNNPQLLRYHNDTAPPLGLVDQVRKGKREDGSPALFTTSHFHPDEKQDPEGQLLSRLVMDGDLPAVSVGFMPLATLRPDTAEERQALGLGPWGVEFIKAELHELSVVAVPCNPNALLKKLDAMKDAGEIPKSLAALTAKMLEPRTRTVHPVAKIEPVGAGAVTPEGDAINKAHDARLTAIEATLAEIKNTLGAELPALRASLEVSRAASAGAPPAGEPPQASANAESDVRATSPEAYARALLDGAVAGIRQKVEGRKSA